MNYIADLLQENGCIGAANGLKVRDILKLLGRPYSSKAYRNITADIQKFRRDWTEADGISSFILSDTQHGYYLPANDNEVIHFFTSLYSRAIETFTTAKPIRGYLKSKGILSNNK